ncbi:GNAT family N-acetyltransferase [Sessilibacter corallicola]|uniref:BioF2-like acetyltransferase domain-containing protein n=1 Tax=Sessilibacter corallicola TaxID=2904075 RepID=A0ABQ0AC06_9GAMM
MNTVIDNFNIHVATSINELDADLWNQKIGFNHAAKSHQFLQIIESSFPARQYFYFSVYSATDNSKPIALFFSCQYRHDLFQGAQGLTESCINGVRHLLKNFGAISIAMTGNPECHSQTWWFDDQAITESQFFSLSTQCLEQHHPKAWLLIVRDFMIQSNSDSHFYDLKSKFGHFSFTSLHPIAALSIGDQSAESHKSRLKRNYRRLIRKSLTDLTQQQYRVERQLDFSQLVDTFYSLYLNVHHRAQEYVREPFPKSFLLDLAKNPFSEATVIYDDDSRVAAFTISIFSSTIYNPYIFGTREIKPDDPNFYYALMWFDLENACHRRMTHMDMGITNYFPKQNFGAELLPLAMAVSVRKPFRWLSTLIAKALAEPQPPIRSGLK